MDGGILVHCHIASGWQSRGEGGHRYGLRADQAGAIFLLH
jgi:hypothetical protein